MSKKKPLWQPTEEQIKSSNLYKFIETINETYGSSFSEYSEIYDWSVKNKATFWKEIWKLADIKYSEKYEAITLEDNNRTKIPRPIWFPGAKLNFAENLLKYRDDKTAIIHRDESGNSYSLSYDSLYLEVARVARGLRKLGVTKGDRVAGFVTNIPEAIIYMLATTSIGAIWSSTSPDFGFEGVMDRFGQIKPKVLVAVNGYTYNGKDYDSREKLEKIVESIDSLEKVVILEKIEADSYEGEKFTTDTELQNNNAKDIEFEQLPFDHPVYIMYSSGTTGVPKCIVHGGGGTLLQHFKEHYLHCNLTRDDLITYFTTCGWMMWNWLVGALSVGATIMTFDGSPSHPDMGILWEAIEEEEINVFGTSPKFLSACQKMNLKPKEDYDLSSLRTILSTGAPLTTENFSYVYSDVKEDVQLASISGGTDIVSCFMLGNPMLPVYDEEIQSRGLGMEVKAFDENGEEVIGEKGELVCIPPFPSMPTHFWDDPDDERYYGAYFDFFDGIWRHGDYVEVNDHGGMVVYGRSDATLNPGGVRIGTAEIYRIVEGMEEVKDSLVVGQNFKGDVRVILYVVLKDGYELDKDLKVRIKNNIKEGATPRHVPKLIKEINQVPVTINGKKVELAVTKILNGEEVKNESALANPESLDQFRS